MKRLCVEFMYFAMGDVRCEMYPFLPPFSGVLYVACHSVDCSRCPQQTYQDVDYDNQVGTLVEL